MNLVVFGASGATGRWLVELAVRQGHSVTAFVRRADSIARTDVRVVQGDVGDRAAVSEVLAGCDAALSALGTSRPLRSDPRVIQGVQHICDALGVRRFVYLSVGRTVMPVTFIVRREIADHRAKEAIIERSRCDATIVRAPLLTANSTAAGWPPRMARRDVAQLMLEQLSAPSRRVVTIFEPERSAA
ncbi:MAG: NAD(P)H-binding protein [Myxococcaceae bacterium]|nr:NAD(P)H-binding protein [Myxococcaceae bacterium]